MPPLRSHKKSRTGCLQCKRRRVKCDEKGHPCGNCAYRQTKCTYPSAAASSCSPGISQSAPSESDHSKNTDSPGIVLDSSNRLLLELMHKYSTETYKTFFSEPADYHVWQAVVPRWAFKYDFLLYGILSVTALHTALALDPVDARPYLDASMDFQSKALRPFQEALQNISLENVDAAFAYSRITIVKGIAFRQVAADINSADDTSMLESIFLLFKLVDGVMAITDMSHEQLRKSALIPRNFWGTAEFTLDSDTNEALTRLSELNTRLNINDDTQYCTIDSAIFRLRQCWQRFHRHGDSTSVLSWLAMAGKEFVIAAMNYESLPLLVLAYWGSLLQQLKGASWWAANSGSALVSDILETLCRSNVDFGEAALWPKRKAGV